LSKNKSHQTPEDFKCSKIGVGLFDKTNEKNSPSTSSTPQMAPTKMSAHGIDVSTTPRSVRKSQVDLTSPFSQKANDEFKKNFAQRPSTSSAHLAPIAGQLKSPFTPTEAPRIESGGIFGKLKCFLPKPTRQHKVRHQALHKWLEKSNWRVAFSRSMLRRI
jgi:hypothetical protein